MDIVEKAFCESSNTQDWDDGRSIYLSSYM